LAGFLPSNTGNLGFSGRLPGNFFGYDTGTTKRPPSFEQFCYERHTRSSGECPRHVEPATIHDKGESTMIAEDIHVTEDIYVVEPGQMITIQILVADFEDEQPSLPGPQQQYQDDFVVLAKRKALSKADPNRKVRVHVKKR